MTAFNDLKAIDSIFGSFKNAKQATEEMAIAYNALTQRQQAFVMSQIGESSALGKALTIRASYTSAIAACSTAEAASILTKKGVAQADAEQVIEAIKCTLQLKQEIGALKELTKVELEQLVVDTMAANGLGRLTEEQRNAVVQFLQTGKAADDASKSFTSFGNVAGQSLKALVSSLLFIITTVITVVNIAVNLIKKYVDTVDSALEKSAELAEEIETNADKIDELGEQLEENKKRLLELNRSSKNGQ